MQSFSVTDSSSLSDMATCLAWPGICAKHQQRTPVWKGMGCREGRAPQKIHRRLDSCQLQPTLFTQVPPPDIPFQLQQAMAVEVVKQESEIPAECMACGPHPSVAAQPGSLYNNTLSDSLWHKLKLIIILCAYIMPFLHIA